MFIVCQDRKWVKAIKVIVEVVSPKGQLLEIGDVGRHGLCEVVNLL